VVDPAELIGHVKSRLAAYKAPKRVIAVTSIGRAANGKLDYKKLRSDAIGASTAPEASGITPNG
jgi:acyl-CoA synthetase (AMP-forming)/AMP-acid ligase II